MEGKTVSWSNAKAHLSELTELAAMGETVLIAKRGKPVARVLRPEPPRDPVNLATLRHLTASMTAQTDDAGTLYVPPP